MSELGHTHLFGLLYQTGYLTIQSRDEFGLYTLDYPNREVKNLMLACLFEAFGGGKISRVQGHFRGENAHEVDVINRVAVR